MKKCNKTDITMNDSTIYTLQFADDQTVLAEDGLDIEYVIRKHKR